MTASCPAVCECPERPLVCPPGVSNVPDGCGCCKVCAAQLNQDCNPMRPCDHHKGLECNYGNDVTMNWGICRGERKGNSVCLKGRNFKPKKNCYFLQLIAQLTQGHSINTWYKSPIFKMSMVNFISCKRKKVFIPLCSKHVK